MNIITMELSATARDKWPRSRSTAGAVGPVPAVPQAIVAGGAYGRGVQGAAEPGGGAAVHGGAGGMAQAGGGPGRLPGCEAKEETINDQVRTSSRR